MTDEELEELIGKPYNRENARKMIYGGRIDSNGVIVKVITSGESKKRCKKSIFSFLF